MSEDGRRKLYKWISYTAVMFVSIILQTTLFSGIRVFSCSPSLIPFIVSCIALIEGMQTGVEAGFVGGFLCDMMYGGHNGFYTFMLPILALVICFMNKVMYWRSYFMSLIDWIVLTVLLNTVLCAAMTIGGGNLSMTALLREIPGEILASIFFTPFLYAIIKKCAKSFENLDD